jgi:hypothetical protein
MLRQLLPLPVELRFHDGGGALTAGTMFRPVTCAGDLCRAWSISFVAISRRPMRRTLRSREQRPSRLGLKLIVQES